MTTNTPAPTSDSHANLSRNPFVVEAPEKLSPQQIVALFVQQYTRLETLKQRRHTFIWGSRGSGKSMMARYLEPRCQATVYGGMDRFLEQPEPFLALYCPCKEGHFNRTELLLLDASSSLILSEHMINLGVADRLVNCLHTQFPADLLPKADLVRFATAVARLFDRASIAASIEQVDEATSLTEEPLAWLQALIAAENRKVNNFLRDMSLHGKSAVYEGATSGYHDFLVPFVRFVQRLPKLDKTAVYLLLDDADRLTREQQSIVNEWIANRDQSALCLKVSARRELYKTLLTRSGGLIEQPHDYSEVDVDELYTRSKSDYSEKVRLISEKRLELSGLPTRSIEAFLPSDVAEAGLFDGIKRETAEEWEKVGKPGRLGDYVHRYATPRLFQHLKATKKPKSYAGFQNLVDMSSGVVRDFLEPCYLMFDQCVSKGQEPAVITLIPPSVQNEVIYKYSEDFLLAKLEDIRQDLPPEHWTQLEGLRRLIESLGRLFYERLHDPSAREARVFSFTVRGSVPTDLNEILRLGMRYRYLQLRTYSTKEGGGRENWYILNRRLCPVYKLDPTGFEGRISLIPEMLRLACEDPDRFVRTRLRQTADDQPPGLFSKEEEQ